MFAKKKYGIRMKCCVLILALLWFGSSVDASIIETFTFETEYQNGKQEIRVLLPDGYQKDVSYQVLYVLPVEKGFEQDYGYALGVLKQMDVHNQHNIIIVQMGFEKEPWFGDHATNPKIRQASYLKEFVVPFIETKYNTMRTSNGRLLFGFSKSGWGAFSLILKYPEYFGYAASWDAPITFAKFRFGMKSIYETSDQLALYRPDLLIPKQNKFFQKMPRLVLTGEKIWSKETVQTHELLEKNDIKHYYDNTLIFPHRWDKSWMAPTLSALMDLTTQGKPTSQDAAADIDKPRR